MLNYYLSLNKTNKKNDWLIKRKKMEVIIWLTHNVCMISK